MTAETTLTSIISNKIIEKIASGIVTEKEVLDLNSKLLNNYLNISKDTSDRLKRSTEIYNFWHNTLQNINYKADYNKFLISINTIINVIPNSMLGQFTKLYNTNILQNQPIPKENQVSTKRTRVKPYITNEVISQETEQPKK